MNIIVIIIFAVSLALAAFCFAEPENEAPAIDPTLARDLLQIESFRRVPTALGDWRLRSLDLSSASDARLKVFLYTSRTPDTGWFDRMESLGFNLYPESYLPPVGAHPYGFILADAAPEAIRACRVEDGVIRVAAAYRRLKPLNDLTARETGAAHLQERQPNPLTGSGVRLAIIDSGFRIGMRDLPDPVEAMDYADYPDTNRDVRDIASGHGTHVAGTVCGSGEASGGRWKGMAPECEPVYLKIGDDSTAEASTAAVVGAIKGAASWCEADILTMSYGGWDGYNDGSSPEEQAVDWAVGEGATAFMSAGNSAGDQIHYVGTVSARSTTDPIQVNIRFAPDSAFAEFYLTWFDGADTSLHRDLRAVAFTSDGDTIPLDSPGRISSLRGTEAVEYLLREPLPPDSSVFFIRVTNGSDVDQPFHLLVLSDHWFVRFARPERSYTVLTPSTADSCISVGAMTTRTSWTDFLGVEHTDNVQVGAIASFSSIGPRIDGVLKPDIVAPGRRTISIRDTATVRFGIGYDFLIVSNDGGTGLPADYLTLMGTSMSSPAAAGSAALIQQSVGRVAPAELRELILRSAIEDEQTGRTPNTIWGWGKFNAAMAVFVEPGKDIPGSEAPKMFRYVSVSPNPVNGVARLSFELEREGEVRLAVFDLSGRELLRKELGLLTEKRHEMDLADIRGTASGSNWLVLSSGGERQVIRITLVK